MPNVPTIKITIDLTSTAQLDAVVAALDNYVDMESDRKLSYKATSHPGDVWEKSDETRLAGARQVLQSLTGKLS